MRKLISKDLIDNFDSMPDKAKALALTYLFDIAPGVQGAVEEITLCGSPIEEILYVALEVMLSIREDEFELKRIDDDFIGYMWAIYPQYEIESNDKTYYADFLVDVAHTGTGDELSLVVECDGHDFHHATKEQVQHDNEREYDLKMAGYDVLRFSGSQIFNQPTKCANDILDYIKMKLEPEEE